MQWGVGADHFKLVDLLDGGIVLWVQCSTRRLETCFGLREY